MILFGTHAPNATPEEVQDCLMLAFNLGDKGYRLIWWSKVVKRGKGRGNLTVAALQQQARSSPPPMRSSETAPDSEASSKRLNWRLWPSTTCTGRRFPHSNFWLRTRMSAVRIHPGAPRPCGLPTAIATSATRPRSASTRRTPPWPRLRSSPDSQAGRCATSWPSRRSRARR